MKLVEFSVTNYRSITAAHKIKLEELTVLVGKNNEGKSNILTALNFAMTAVILHSNSEGKMISNSAPEKLYNWERDFPLQLKNRKNGLESIFRLIFQLNDSEISELHRKTGIRGNEAIPIEVRIGKENKIRIKVPKKGTSSYNQKSSQITEFISKKITFNYIVAVRTERMAIDALQAAISSELRVLEENEQYAKAIEQINELEQGALDNIANKLVSPLQSFLPTLKNVFIVRDSDWNIPWYFRQDIDVILDDGNATSIRNKGDGIKSLVTLAILKDRQKTSGASVIAIEEPESHLHPGAIHSLVEVVHKMTENNQVIITTHNPLFVQQNKVSSNILVDHGTARPAKSIAEIREILGVLPSDNLRNARYVILVEGQDDKISLEKILSNSNSVIKGYLANNELVIKPLRGAGNLLHDLADLKNSMCRYVVLLDNDKAGREAATKAIDQGLLKHNEIRYTICNGSPESEFEDCIRPDIYAQKIKEIYGVMLDRTEFHSNNKWSERMKNVFFSQGQQWSSIIEEKLKILVAESIPNTFENVNTVLIEQKSGFLDGLITITENMLKEENFC